MTSPHWDEAQAEAYRQFKFDFPEKSLAGKAVVVAGGAGGLGAATVSLLAREGAHLIVGYRVNRERASSLSAAMEKQFGVKVTLVGGDIGDDRVGASFWKRRKKLARRWWGRRFSPVTRRGWLCRISIAILFLLHWKQITWGRCCSRETWERRCRRVRKAAALYSSRQCRLSE